MTQGAAQTRRARTRALIEFGGLVTKSGLPALIAPREADTQAVVLGALLDLADAFREADPASAIAHVTRWRTRGRAAFRADAPDDTTRSTRQLERGTPE